jgi:hypothetical protein
VSHYQAFYYGRTHSFRQLAALVGGHAARLH